MLTFAVLESLGSLIEGINWIIVHGVEAGGALGSMVVNGKMCKEGMRQRIHWPLSPLHLPSLLHISNAGLHMASG